MGIIADFIWDWHKESPKEKISRLFEEEQRATKQEKQRIWEDIQDYIQ